MTKSKCPYCHFGANGLPEKYFRNECSGFDPDFRPVFCKSFLQVWFKEIKPVIVLQKPGSFGYSEKICEYINYCPWCGRKLSNENY